jgi:membrane protein YqaA with SNARE-associated domain
MAGSTTEHHALDGDPDLPRHVSIGRWFLFYALLVAAAALPLVLSIERAPEPFQQVGQSVAALVKAIGPMFRGRFAEFSAGAAAAGAQFERALHAMTATDKLLIMALYLSLCTTFTPLSTNWIVAVLSMGAAAVSGNHFVTVLSVSTVAAAASTVANLNDYHLMLLVLRSRRIAKVRNTRTYHAAAAWFARAPLTIMLVFNVLSIPVDVSRVLAALYGFPRLPFAGINFLGRWLRYAIIAIVTVLLGSRGWIAPLVLLGLATAVALGRAVPVVARRLVRRSPQQ